MKVLIVGGGGREHALAWRILADSPATQVVSCPGNGGLSTLGPLWEDLNPETQGGELLERVRRDRIDFVVIGPEAPLVAGLADRLREAGVLVFGPGRRASMLEGSKAFAKDFMIRNGVPTARFHTVQDPSQLEEALRSFPAGVVVKASGLAAGKGVILTSARDEARGIALEMLSGKSFGPAGQTVVLEELLTGVEMTMLVLVHGDRYVLLDSAQDYKTFGEGNTGPNTGGMGSYSPTRMLTTAVRSRILEDVVHPTLKGFSKDGIHFSGLLYLGPMLTPGGPLVLEYNVRFGDPEAQALLPRLEGNLLDILMKISSGDMDTLQFGWKKESAVSVILASRGYPGSYQKGLPIHGPVISAVHDPVQVFHAGTRRAGEGFVTAGGRVLTITALGSTLNEARQRVYDRIAQIHWPGMAYRKDIAQFGVA